MSDYTTDTSVLAVKDPDACIPDSWVGLRHPIKARFLAAYAQTGTVRGAAEIAQCARNNHFNWLSTDPEYAKAFEQAKTLAIQAAEDECTRRAIHGVESGVFFHGQKVATEQKYSDILLMFKLKGELPAKYRESAQQVNVQVAVKAYSGINVEEDI